MIPVSLPPTLVVATALALLGPAPERPERPTLPVLGTIEATIDGVATTWYVVEGEASDGAYASGLWIGEVGDVTVSIGGYDREDVPIERFSRGFAEGTTMTLGGYEGSVATLMFPLPADGGPATLEASLEAGTTMTYDPSWSDDAPTEGVLALADGTIEVTSGRIEDGTVTVEGTFSGTLTPMFGEGTGVEVTDGRFRVGGLPHADAVMPGG